MPSDMSELKRDPSRIIFSPSVTGTEINIRPNWCSGTKLDKKKEEDNRGELRAILEILIRVLQVFFLI